LVVPSLAWSIQVKEGTTVSIRCHFHTAFRSFPQELSSLAGTIIKLYLPDWSK